MSPETKNLGVISQEILRLNQEGFSNTEITIRLKEKGFNLRGYGEITTQKIARRLGELKNYAYPVKRNGTAGRKTDVI